MVWGVELCGASAHHPDHLRQQWSGGRNSVESLLINCLDTIINIIPIIPITIKVMTIFTSGLVVELCGDWTLCSSLALPQIVSSWS